MAKIAKCQYCDLKDTMKEDMEFEMVGTKKPVPKYYHKECWEKHLEDKAFKEVERLELDKLVEVIKEIYGIKVIPNNAFPYLQNLRNGTKFFGKYDYSYKKGYNYALIADTFEYCSESIDYANANKSFNGFTNALRYGLAIVCDKLSVVEQRKATREKQRHLIELHHSNEKEVEEDFETSYKKPKKSNADITDFLDD